MTPQPPSVRVVIASRIFWPESAAASFRLKAVAQALARGLADVLVLTARAPRASVEPTPAGSRQELRDVQINRWPVLRDDAGYVRGYLPYMSFDVPLALRLLAIPEPDVILVEPPPTTGAVVRVVLALRAVLTRRRVVPYVYYAADIWSDATASTGAPTIVVTALRALERFALRGASEVIAVSDGVADRARQLRAGHASSVHVIPNGIDTETFTLAADDDVAVGAADRAPERPYLVYAGTASEWQGAEIFAAAMEQVHQVMPQARLVFLGQGSSWPALQRAADRLPEGTIELRPLAPPHEAAVWQRRARACLVSVKPGLGYDFAYPTKVLASLACGTPVVFAGVGPAASDVAAHDLGESAAYDVDAVAEAMVRALTAPENVTNRERLARWVADNRSLARTGQEAAALVRRAALTQHAARTRRAALTQRTTPERE